MAEAFPSAHLGLLISVKRALSICHGIFNLDNSDEAASHGDPHGPEPSTADSTTSTEELPEH